MLTTLSRALRGHSPPPSAKSFSTRYFEQALSLSNLRSRQGRRVVIARPVPCTAPKSLLVKFKGRHIAPKCVIFFHPSTPVPRNVANLVRSLCTHTQAPDSSSAPDSAPDSAPPSIFNALRDELSLVQVNKHITYLALCLSLSLSLQFPSLT